MGETADTKAAARECAGETRGREVIEFEDLHV